ncbi:MAG: WhiB family transcriptional regulator [Pirellulales bacterium]
MKLALDFDFDLNEETPRRAEQWMDLALCAAEADPDIFFPKTNGAAKKAKATCARCAVVAECLAFSQENSIIEGVWGGLTETERGALEAVRAGAPE